jgi:hypothetical protein
MDDIIFHSLYSEQQFKTLKHSLLYFDKIIIPSNNYACSFGEKNPHPHWLKLIPDNVYDEIEYLKNEKLVNLHWFENSHFDDIAKYYGAISEVIHRLGKIRNYSKSQIHELAKHLNISPNHPDFLSIINEASIFIAAICLMEFSEHNLRCCNDNQIIHDTFNLGLKGVLQFANEKTDLRSLKRNILSQKVLSLNLPSFEFQTFDDVLEIKEKHKNELLALNNHLDDMTEKLEISPLDHGFSEAIDRLITNRIQPQIEDLKKSISFSPSRIAKRIYDPIKNFGMALGFSSCFPDYTKEIAAIGLTASVVESAFKDIAETKQKVKNSPYNIFISL